MRKQLEILTDMAATLDGMATTLESIASKMGAPAPATGWKAILEDATLDWEYIRPYSSDPLYQSQWSVDRMAQAYVVLKRRSDGSLCVIPFESVQGISCGVRNV